MSIITFKQSDREKTEAVGSLYQREILAYLVSLKIYFKFCRSKFDFYKKHNKNIKIKKFDNLFQFLNNSKIPQKKKNLVKISSSKQLHKDSMIYNIPFHVSEKIITNTSLLERTKLIKKFRREFWSFNKKKINKDNKSFTIVLHIRNKSKGDTISGMSTLPYQIFNYDYGLPNNNPIFYKKWYLLIVKKILSEINSSKKKKILICSTGKKSDFLLLKKELDKICKTDLYLNIDEFKTFKKMITADYLVLSQSSFSYLASLISNGKKYIRNGFRHPLSSDVNIIRDDILMKIPYFYFIFYNILEKAVYLKLFFKNTDFRTIIKNKFKFF